MLASASKLAIVGIGLAGVSAAGTAIVFGLAVTGATVPYGAVLLLGVVVTSLAALVLALEGRQRRSITLLAGQLAEMAESDDARDLSVQRGDGLEEIAGSLNTLLAHWQKRLQQQRAAEDQLQVRAQIADAERRQIEEIVLSISDAVIVTNRFDELLLANAAAERLLRFEMAGAERTNIQQVLDDEELVRLIQETRAQGRKGRRKVVEHGFDTAGGRRVFQVALSRTGGAADGDVAGVVTVCQDVTKEKEIAQMKTDFVSNVSHELRTPLASIKAYVEMLLDGDADSLEAQREFHEIISGETDRLSRLIDNILNLSRIEAGVVKVVKEPENLTAVVKEALEVAGSQAAAKGIRLTEQLAPVFAQISADRDMISQAVMNLLSNAIKYTEQGGVVTVSTSVDEGRGVAACEVADTGVGIPVEALPHVFDKFYRVKSNNGMAKGTGLGLPLVKHIIETVHDGRIEVDSHVGRGSVFRFEMPLCV